MDYVYDCETYPNIFTMAISSVDKKEALVFEISERRDDSNALRRFLGKLYHSKSGMIGFNNLGFDWPVVDYFLKNRGCSYKDIYDFAQEVIDSFDGNRFKYVIPAHKTLIKQIDLFKIHHFDNKSRATSLKMLEFNMRSPNIEDLPFPPGTILTYDEMDTLIVYNVHDVKETFKFYKESTDKITFREELSAKYKQDFTNHNDTKIGKDYFILELEKAMPGCCYRKLPKGGRKINQTKRDYIDLGEVIFPYIKFERPEFRAVLDWLREQRISETKGVFTDIEEHLLGEVPQYANLLTKKKKFKDKPTQKDLDAFYAAHPKGWVEEKLLKSGKISYYGMWRQGNLNTIVDGFQYDFGTGGIHGSIESATVLSDEEYVIVDLDVASYYPNLAIANRIYPEHLGEKFCDIYLDVYLQRKQYPKKSSENLAMKLALNGTYGASNDKYSPFFDPKFTMAITVNGQLSLCMLAEELIKIENLQMIQVNTDGLTVRVPRIHKKEVDRIAKEWEDTTKLELEEAIYDKMFIRDVNSYIAVYTNGDVKRKGAYEFEDLDWNKNHSSLVIQKAASHALVEGGDVEDFIRNHDDKYDFMLRTKVPRSSRLVSVDDEGDEYPEQNICRYYISNEGMKLIKIMPPLPGKDEERRIGVDTDWFVKTCNDMTKFSWDDIEYDYYITEAKKLVDPLTNDPDLG